MPTNIYPPKVILIIMDGWGQSKIKKGNAVLQAKTPTFDYLCQTYPHTSLQAFGINVGLPWGTIGSSEVGHLTIGSGRAVLQEYSFIEEQIGNLAFFHNKKLIDLIKKTQKSNRDLHLIGLLSDGGIHSHVNHLFAILELLKMQKFNLCLALQPFRTEVLPSALHQKIQQKKEQQKDRKSDDSRSNRHRGEAIRGGLQRDFWTL